jgi:predicted ATP-grasp superfamily ATP-dependent carboligase
LLDALDWKGVAMIECKRDPETGRHAIMEINGRFWARCSWLSMRGSISHCPRAVRPGPVPPEPTGTTYRVGVRSRWFWGDVDHLYMRLTRSLAELQAA